MSGQPDNKAGDSKGADRPRSAGKRSGPTRRKAAATGATEALPQELLAQSLKSSENIYDEAVHLVTALKKGEKELGRRLVAGGQARPYLAAGAVTGVGFVLGGGLTLGLTRKLVAVGGRLMLSMAVRRLLGQADKFSQ